MTTTVQAVERYLETDLVFHEARARGFLNIRRAARWLIETQGWDTTEEAVVSALRRYEPKPTVDIENALHLLGHSRRAARTGLATVKTPRTREYVSRLSGVTSSLESDERFTLFSESKQLVFVVESSAVEKVLKVFEPLQDHELQRDVAEIELQFPQGGHVASTAMAIALNVLGHRGVEVVAMAGPLPVCSIFVPERQFAQTYRIVAALGSGP